MKRSVLALFLAAVLVVSLTACGGRQESDNSAKSADAAVSEKQESRTERNSTASVNAAGEQSTVVPAAESVNPAGSGANLSNGSASGSVSSAGTTSGTSNKPGSNANTGAGSGNTSGGNIGGANSSGASGSSGPSNQSSGSNSSGAKPTEPPAKHTHQFVDVGVQALEWSAAQQDNTGPTNTREQVSAVNVCISCGYFYGNDDDKFAERYIDHILGPNSSQNCTGAYTLAPIYACYHLLECSCGTLKRGKFDHYEYLMYFNGTNNAATKFVLKDWQIQELGLSHA